jgi:hypothetical protein
MPSQGVAPFIFAVVLASVFMAVSAAPSAAQGKMKVTVSAVPPVKGGNSHYGGNRAPLLPAPLIKLPIGCVRPEGWARQQLELMADGMVGHLPEVSRWAKFKGSAWAGKTGQGAYGWEEMPYWLKGYIDLGYILGDKRIIAESERWVEAILSSQRPDGYFGPESNRAAPDLWPNMLALFALRSHYEATGDQRVLRFMERYFRWQASLPLWRFLPNDWQKVRGGDNLDVLYWLYNQTGAKWLLDQARVNHERTADWTGGVASWHGVNFAQCFREPGQFYQQARDPRYLKATERDYDTMREMYGQVPGGMYGADENARPGFTGPRQGTETCSFVEMMYSDEELLRITGDGKWADRCEDIAFNSLPCAMTPDLKGLHYLTCPNQIQLDRRNKAPMIQNGGDMMSYSPDERYRCCQHNVAFGWPYYAERLWMATPGNGLAAVLYAPCSVTAKVADGTTVKIAETTGYPFDEIVALALTVSKPARFPLTLRIPGWCDHPKLTVNGAAVALPSPARGWIVLEREWKTGDRVALDMPMTIRVQVWERNRNTVSVSRGPLTYSLQIGERWEQVNPGEKWANYEVYPTTPWNYGLIVDVKNPAASFEVVKKGGEVAPQPFTPDAAPVMLKAKGRRIPEWTQETNGLIGEVQPGPVKSGEPVEEITLIPMGCARLRVSAFPQIGDRPNAREWGQGAAGTATASFDNSFDTLSALNDDMLPKNSADQSIPRFTWWDHRGTQEWAQYDFPKPRMVGSCEVYWFDDEAIGGNCRVPASWRLLWWDGNAWQPAAVSGSYETAKDRLNRVKFAPVETARLRMEVKLRDGWSGGILEWRVND